MRKLLLAFLFLFTTGLFAFDLKAQPGGGLQIQGKVVDESGAPIPGVSIYPRGVPEKGTATLEDGSFRLTVESGDVMLVFSAIGYVARDVKASQAKRVVLAEDHETLKDAVVTGIFTRKKDSFTGAVQTITSDDLKRVGNANVIESLKNIDPSLLVMENLQAGSNPNVMASMQLRGASSLQMETSALKSNFVNDANMPLFILDGFETSIEKITDMDMNRVQSITILKDASAKAIYGSKGANGVIVVETKALTGERTLVTYTGSVTLETPDLSSYNLCNAYEKLQVEWREGRYFDNSSETTADGASLYYERLKRALEGESTYWLSKPVRMGVGQKHSLSVEMGDKALKSLITFAYNDVQGAMKGSWRNIVSGDANVSYRTGKWVFRNIMSVGSMKGQESPWGSFADYAAANPYHSPYDENGNLKKLLVSGNYGSYIQNKVANPMWNATVGAKETTQYLDFTDNFYAEYYVIPSVKLVGRLGVDTKKTQADDFRPAEHTDFMSDTIDRPDDFINRGSYTLTTGNYLTYSGDASAQFNQTFGGLHDVFATAQYNISETRYDEVTNVARGFPNSNMNNYTLARQYATASTPTGGDGITRSLGALLTTGYSYDNRYMADATIKGSAASVFGTDRHWGIFWSGGLAWNLHNEQFLSGAKNWLQQFKLRASVGSSGNQNFASNVTLPVYRYFTSSYYGGFTGAELVNMENPFLRWEEKMDYNVGVDFRTKRVNLVVDAYIADTRNLVFARSLVPSTGFATMVDNMGQVRNRGVEVSLSYTLLQRGSSFLTVFGKAAFNDNRLHRISEALDAYNKQQTAAAEAVNSPLPVIQYYPGMPLHSIWAVESLGIDSRTGSEVYIDRNGEMTTEWNSADLKNFGTSDPVVNGNFGVSGELRGFGFNAVMTFRAGGKLYNTTLLNKVENVNLEYNVDRRVFEGRWFEPGQVTPFRGISGILYDSDTGAYHHSVTRATSRFIQRNDVLNVSSLSLYYEFPYAWVQRLKMNRLRATLYANDVFTFSSIRIERGTSYPYARSFSFSLTATF